MELILIFILGDAVIKAYRQRQLIWDKDRTVIVFVSDKLKAGQVRGIYQSLGKAEKKLKALQASLASPSAKKRKKINWKKQLQQS